MRLACTSRESVGDVLITPVIASVAALCVDSIFSAVPFEPCSLLFDEWEYVGCNHSAATYYVILGTATDWYSCLMSLAGTPQEVADSLHSRMV